MFPLYDLEQLLNAIPDPVFVKDRQHRWVLLNDAYCRFMGHAREQLIGKSDRDFFPAAEADVFWDKDEYVFDTGAENTNDENFTDSSGYRHCITTKKSLYVSSTGEKFIVGCIRDVTELQHAQQALQAARDQLEETVQKRTAELAATNEALLQQIAETDRTAEQLRQSQKMEAIGRFAGGVAHDFNNLLNIIIGYTALIEARASSDLALCENAGQITKAADQAATLIRQLLAFSRKQVLQPELLDLQQVLSGMKSMLGRLLGEDVEVNIQADVPACIKADRGQIEQVILNLAVNARDAMPLGGKLGIEVRPVEINDYQTSHNGIQPGRYVRLSVSDTGEGMDPGTQAHIFEPFFTTKEPGKGTGLGLATVYGIVTQSNGHIRVLSTPGQGTTFSIYLPFVAGVIPMPAPTPDLPCVRHGSGTILLVEDEADLRKLFREVLQAKGYKVLEAASGEMALGIASAHSGRIDLMITDVIMPGMRGWELAQRLRPVRQEMKVLYMSGHTDGDLSEQGADIRCGMLLEKPFRPDVLLLKVQELLASKPESRHTSAS
jgi:PAS domain S-box-containing protein